jgi:hypothetical protein
MIIGSTYPLEVGQIIEGMNDFSGTFCPEIRARVLRVAGRAEYLRELDQYGPIPTGTSAYDEGFWYEVAAD